MLWWPGDLSRENNRFSSEIHCRRHTFSAKLQDFRIQSTRRTEPLAGDRRSQWIAVDQLIPQRNFQKQLFFKMAAWKTTVSGRRLTESHLLRVPERLVFVGMKCGFTKLKKTHFREATNNLFILKRSL